MNPVLDFRGAKGRRQPESFLFHCLLSCAFLAVPVIGLLPIRAQETGGEVTYTRQQIFRIPFQTEPGERRLKQIQLYVSTDSGRSWHPYANVRPEEGNFTFTASRDGLYWFTVRTVDHDNRASPLTMENARPGLKVHVDTQAPVVNLRSQPAREGVCGVEWDVQDEAVDPASIMLEYRPQGKPDWTPLPTEPVASGQHSWKPSAAGTLEMRLRARDRAGNEADGRTTVVASAETSPPAPRPTSATPGGGAAVRMVNSKRIGLNYEVREVGPSGVSVVELWYTQDGRNWQKYSEQKCENPGQRMTYNVDVNDEGLYGFSLVVRSGVGLGDRPPQVGDPPQVWVEVDTIKPIVRLQSVDVGRGPEAGNLTVTWTATDKNLSRQPITLSYAEDPKGPWAPIANNQENAGRHVWRIPSGIPFRFHVRVEATDRAGNIGSAETAKHIIVDLSQPKGVIMSVEPAKQ